MKIRILQCRTKGVPMFHFVKALSPRSLPLLLGSAILGFCLSAQATSTDHASAQFEDLEARSLRWNQANPHSLPHWLTPDEIGRVNENSRTFTETDPPVGEIRNVAEFERMESVLVRYPFGISTSLIAAMSQDTPVLTLVSSSSQENTVRSQYQSAGVNMANTDFLLASTDSYWSRDYGPWFVQVDAAVSVVNFPYNRPRPGDNDVPIHVANALGVDLYGMDLTTAGGNYMCDGYGAAASSDLIWSENSSMSHNQVATRVQNYLGIDNYHVLPDPNNTYIDHIDCWGKFLDVDKVLIREVPASHAQYEDIEATADYFANTLSSWGNPYEVYRVYTPNNQPYTNSLILNEEVFVPVTGSSWDDEALAAYAAAMPGYDIQGFTGSWESTDALHCRTKGVADTGLLHLHHTPLFGAQAEDSELEIQVEITACSGSDLIASELFMRYRVNASTWNQVPLTPQAGTYTAMIPAQSAGSWIDYVLYATDGSGRSETHPFIGEADPHHFTAGLPVPPELSVTPLEINMQLDPNTNDQIQMQITNTGGGVLDWSMILTDPTVPTLGTTGTADSRSVESSTVSLSPAEFTPGESGVWTVEITNGSTDSEWILDLNVLFPLGITITSADDLVGGTGGALSFTGSLGDGASLNWHGTDASNWGVLQDGESASGDIHYTVSADYQGDANIAWNLAGDEYGSAPHTLDGDLILTSLGPPITWIQLSGELSGALASSESAQVLVQFDSANLLDGLYTATLQINEIAVPVALTVSSQADLESPALHIRVLGTTVILEWLPVPGATAYRVEATTDPTGTFTEVAGTFFEGGWVSQISESKLIYRVIALND
jgi:agmatine deiminase